MTTPDTHNQLLLWDTSIAKNPDGTTTLTPRKPLATCSIERVLTILGLSDTRGARSTIYSLVRCKILKATKPGAIHNRRDNKKSNARLVFDMESVLLYKQKLQQ